MIQNIFIGIPGSGKTHRILQEVVATPSKYIITMPRRDFIEESYDKLTNTLLEQGGTSIAIDRIYSSIDGTSQIPVATQIRQAPQRYINDEHVVLFATHEGLMNSDLSQYQDWNLYIDETPNAVISDAVIAPVTVACLRYLIDLQPIPKTNWSLATPNGSTPDHKSILQDHCFKHMAEFFKRLRSPRGVYVNITVWDAFIASGKTLQWHSLWDLNELQMFKSVTVAGAGFFDSLLYKSMMKTENDGRQFNRIEIGEPRTRLPNATIRYFTRGHRGSTHFWKDSAGKECLAAIARYFSKYETGNYYWSANSMVRHLLSNSMSGLEVRPKQEGSNKLTGYDTAVMIYSSKPQKGDRPLRDIHGLSKEDIERAREIEDLIQFVMRGSIRNPQFLGEYTIYVYDQHQADMLAEYLVKNRIAAAKTEPVDEAGIMDIVRPQAGRKSKQSNSTSAAISAEKRREQDALRKKRKRQSARQTKIASGTYVPRGRPTKASSLANNKAKLDAVLKTLKTQREA